MIPLCGRRVVPTVRTDRTESNEGVGGSGRESMASPSRGWGGASSASYEGRAASMSFLGVVCAPTIASIVGSYMSWVEI